MKYIIELEDKPVRDLYGENENYYKCKQMPYWYLPENLVNRLTPHTEPNREAIENEVWKFLVFLIDEMDVDDKYECFNQSSAYRIASTMTYQEAKAKYEEWKKQKDEIHVGDEIYSDGDYEKAVVMEIHGDGSVSVYTKNGCIEHWWNKMHNLKKTGRHFDEVTELLEKMRDTE